MSIESKTLRLSDGGIVSFRPVEPGDTPLLLDAYASTRAEELAQTNWDQSMRDAFLRTQFTAQQADYQTNYPGARHLIILLNGKGSGRIWLAQIGSDTGDAQTQILDITILPRFRNTGLGTAIIRDLMEQSSASGTVLSIYVESYNRSLGMFERLGFKKAGEVGYSYLMKFDGRLRG
ncbi:MAG TPA: GNAT family N-acetyltransferase [Blastocatellia bacterium]